MLVHEFIFAEGTLALKAEARDWKAAVKIGTDLLEKKGFLQPSYYHDIVKQHEEI